MADSRVSLSFVVNGRETTVEVHPMARLLDVLRTDLHLTGTKEGCGEGECGACAVLLDGALVNSCLVPALHAGGTRVKTIEGVASGDALHAVQEAFIAHGAAQCGICTPGMVLAVVAYVDAGGIAEDEAVRAAVAGNLCRCTGYTKIFEAIRAVLERGVE